MIHLMNCRISLTSEVKNAQWKKDHTLICPICGKPFIGYGNNPYPVANDGRCCDDCNPWVIMMRNWLERNHDRLNGMVDKLSCKHYTIASHCYINGESIAFAFYKDVLTKKLEVTVVCDDALREKVVVGTLHNWITSNCSDKDLKGVQPFAKGLISNQMYQFQVKFKKKIEAVALEDKKLDSPYLMFDSGYLNKDDKDVAHFGLVVWSKGDGVLNVEPFFLGINECSEFARWWDKLVKEKFFEMINNQKDRIPYLPANSKEEAMCEMYMRIFNKVSLTIK